ncbi:MAG: FAD/NAD(P)-binding oxidoreductase [Candidatus Bathyarchaeia archaeon]
MRIIIIGNGIAGISALREMRKYDKYSEIIVLSREKLDESRPFYSPAAIPYYIENRLSKDNLFSRDLSFYQKNNAKLYLGEDVKLIDTSRKVVSTGKKEIPYDKLVIASGAAPRRLKIPNSDRAFVVRTYDDAERLKSSAGEEIAIIGGGPVGVEISLSLRKLGKRIKLIEALENILSTVFSRKLSNMIEGHLRRDGIEIYKEEKVVELKDEPERGVRTEKSFYRADTIVMAVGVKPNTEFVDESIKLGKSGGIIVDEYMKTSSPDVYAAGDCIELKHALEDAISPIPTWTNAFETGKVAGANVVGERVRHDGGVRLNSINIDDRAFFSMGNAWKYDERIEIEKDGILEIYYSRDGKIVGAEIVGDVRWSGLLKRYLMRRREIFPVFNGIDEVKKILLNQGLLF